MKRIWLYAVTALLLSGCEGFLDTENLIKKDDTTFPLDEADANLSLTGCYSILRQLSPGEYGQCFFLTAELLSDDRFAGGGPDDRRMQAVDRLKKVDDNMFSDVWKQDYRGIYRCNMLLSQLDDITWSSDEARHKVEGEARFLRAYFYFDLCRMFGTVPLITTPQSENAPRASADALYAQMGTDLTEAIRLLPSVKYSTSDNTQLGHATKWAAEALLARVYLFYTGYYQKTSMPLTDGTLTTADVTAWLDDCIDHSGHGLVDDFRNLWPYSNVFTKKDYAYAKENNLNWVGEDGANIETVFAIRYSSTANFDVNNPWYNNVICLYCSPREPVNLADIFPFGIGWGVGTVNPQLWNDWPEGDLRKEGSILSVEKEMPDYVWGRNRQMNETGYWQKKYMAVNAYNDKGVSVNYNCLIYPDISSDYQLNNTQDLVVIRFADVLLMAAELKKDAEPLNRVRRRAGLPDVAYSEEALRDERRWELAFEGLRYYDLLRWGIAGEALSRQNGVTVKDNLVETRMDMADIATRLEETKGLLPLPKTQIDLSDGMLEQNPGWGSDSYMN